MSTLTITEFLEARIAEDEALSSSFPGRHWTNSFGGVEDDQLSAYGTPGSVVDVGFEGSYQDGALDHFARHDPARVLAECAAKRAIITSYASCKGAEAATDITKEFGVKLTVSGMVKGLELAVKHLAAVYADHADYRQEWAL